MIADLAQDVNARQSLAIASKDGVHLLTVQVSSVQVTLVLAQLAEKHLQHSVAPVMPNPVALMRFTYAVLAETQGNRIQGSATRLVQTV